MERAIVTWNDKLAELWQLITQTPETFKGGQIWSVIVNINSALTGIGYGLLVLFFAIGIFSSAASFKELQRPEFALRHFIRFVLAKVAVGRGMEIMTVIFAIIYADPPWRYRMYRGNGYIERHYPTMELEQITALPVKELAEMRPLSPNRSPAKRVRFGEGRRNLWIWGFRGSYANRGNGMEQVSSDASNGIFWGLGYWTRSNVEICMLVTKGQPKRAAKNIHQVIISHVEEHSKKPAEARRRIEALMGDVSKIELFARRPARGWDVWGNEVVSDIVMKESDGID